MDFSLVQRHEAGRADRADGHPEPARGRGRCGKVRPAGDHAVDDRAITAAIDSGVMRSLSGFIGAIGCESFAQQALQALNGSIEAASWSVYERFVDRPPVLHLSASQGVTDTTRACFAAYVGDGLYRRDDTLASVMAPAGSAVLIRMRAEDAPNTDHRDAIYRRHGLVERLTVATRRSDGAVLAVNLYRHVHQGRFGAGEVDRFADSAPLMLACVQRHLALRREPDRKTPPDLRAALAARCPALTGRELDVLERLLQGLSYDGIAADLGLSRATVKTYRARAFGRLGLHFKSQLFAALGPASSATAARQGHPLG